MLSGKLSVISCQDPNQERSDFHRWLKLNRRHFRESQYKPDEIAYFAHLNGFDVTLVASILSHYSDVIQGTNFDNRASMHVETECWTIENMAGKITLDEQWRALAEKVHEGRDFDE